MDGLAMAYVIGVWISPTQPFCKFSVLNKQKENCMKRVVTMMMIAAVFTECKKDQTNMPSTQGSKITGKWKIITVTVIPLDSTGKAKNTGNTITEPSLYYFEFNADNTWTETFMADPNANLGEHGTYRLYGDAGFGLINTNAPAKAVDCRIVTLTNTSLTFKFARPTLFDGITPGYLQYIFQLEK
jgi:hypothetical protein